MTHGCALAIWFVAVDTPLTTLLFCVGGLALVAGALVFLYRSLVHDRSHGRLRCPKCWYDMRAATSLVCPECGHDARTPTRLLKTRRSRRGVVAAMLLVMLATYLHPVHRRLTEFKEPWGLALVPTTALAVGFGWIDEPARAAAFKRFDPQLGQARSWEWQDALLAKRLETMAIADREGWGSLDRLCDLSVRSNAAAEALSRQVAPTFQAHKRYMAQLIDLAGRPGAPALCEVLVHAVEQDRARLLPLAHRSAIYRDLRLHSREYSDELLIRVAKHARAEVTYLDLRAFDYALAEMARRPRSWPMLVNAIRSPYPSNVANRAEAQTNHILLRAIAQVEGGDDPIAMELTDASFRNAARGTGVYRLSIKVRPRSGTDDRFPVVSTSGRLMLELRDSTGRLWTAGDTRITRDLPLYGSAEQQRGLLESVYIDPIVVFGALAPGAYTLTVRHHPYASPDEPDDWFLASAPATFPIIIDEPRIAR